MQASPPLPDLIAVLAVLASAATWLRVVYLLLRRRHEHAGRICLRWTVCAGVYLALSLAISALRPERSIGLGDRWCFDDWCVSVDHVTRSPANTDAVYTLELQTYNEARRPQAVRYPWMFVRDQQGRRYEPQTPDWIVQVESRIPPQQSKRFSVTFRVPADARRLTFVTGHGSGTPCLLATSVLLIGEGGCLFQKYDSIRLE